MRQVMTTITLDILDEKAINLLKDLESLKIIRLHETNEADIITPAKSVKKYKGLMTQQSVEEIEKQLSDLRN